MAILQYDNYGCWHSSNNGALEMTNKNPNQRKEKDTSWVVDGALGASAGAAVGAATSAGATSAIGLATVGTTIGSALPIAGSIVGAGVGLLVAWRYTQKKKNKNEETPDH